MTYSIIGSIRTKTGNTITLEDGNIIDETEVVVNSNGIPYYHVNVLLDGTAEEIDSVKPYIVEVATPQRVFAGRSDTVCLKFADRNEWLALGIEKVEEIV